MRQIVLDTEVTGINVEEGHRLIEIAGIELIDGMPTGKTWHQYINPRRASDAEALAIHGLSEKFLAQHPVFEEIAEDFLGFIDNAELVIHNAAFDLAFLRSELQMVGIVPDWIEQHCTVVDTYLLAKKLFPGQRNTLCALCERFGINTDKTKMSGAMLDAALLAEVYLKLRKM